MSDIDNSSEINESNLPVLPKTSGHDANAPGLTPVVTEKRTSLLDIIRERNLKANLKHEKACRIVVCGKLTRPLESKDEVNNYYQKVFKNFNPDTEFVSGLLLLYPSAFVHCLEAPLNVLNVFIKDFLTSNNRSQHVKGSSESGHKTSNSTIDSASGTNNNNNNNKGTSSDSNGSGTQIALDKKKSIHEFFKDVRIVSYQEDIGERVFSFWAIRNISVSMEEIVPDENIMNANVNTMSTFIVPVVQSIINLGKQLSVLSKADLKGALDDIQTKYKDLIPKAEILLALTLTVGLISVNEWIDLFYCHFFRPADNDIIWPAPKMIEI